MSQNPNRTSITAATDTPQTAHLTPEETPGQFTQQVRALLATIPGLQLLTAGQRRALRRNSPMPEAELRAAIHLLEASDKVAQAIGTPAAGVRQLLDDAGHWTRVENELRGLLTAVADANLLRRHRAEVVALQAYGIARQLTRDPANAVLVPHVQEVQRLKALRRRKTPAGGDAPPAPELVHEQESVNLSRKDHRTESSTLLASPPCDPLLDLFVRNEVSPLRRLEAPIDLLLNVDVVLDVVVRHFVRQAIEQSANFFFRDGSAHGRSSPAHLKLKALPIPPVHAPHRCSSSRRRPSVLRVPERRSDPSAS